MSRPDLVYACAVFVGMVAFGFASSPADAETSMHFEVGYGGLSVRDLPAPSTAALTAGAGVSFPSRPLRLALEVAGAGSLDMSLRIPEAPAPGQRSLMTILVGLEAAGGAHARGLFAVAGVGVGHSTLNGATPRMEAAPGPIGPIANRSQTDMAFGAGVGWRSTGGPGPMGFQVGLRYHAVVYNGVVAGSATTFTLGLAY